MGSVFLFCLEEAVQAAAAGQTGEQSSHETTSGTTTSPIVFGIVALRRRTAGLAIRTWLRGIGALSSWEGTLLLVVVSHLRTLLIVGLLLTRRRALLVWILLIATVGRLGGTWGRTVGGWFVLLVGHDEAVMRCATLKRRGSGGLRIGSAQE